MQRETRNVSTIVYCILTFLFWLNNLHVSNAVRFALQAHEFDPCRFDVAVNDCTWCLRADSPEEKEQWLKVLIASKVSIDCIILTYLRGENVVPTWLLNVVAFVLLLHPTVASSVIVSLKFRSDL